MYMGRFFRQWRPACIAVMGILALTACSDKDEPAGSPDEGNRPTDKVSFSDDLLNGGLVYVAEYSASEGFNIPLKTNRPVRFKVCNDTPFTVETTTGDDGGEYLIGRHSGTFRENSRLLVMRAENTMNPRDFRHFLVVVVNKDAIGRRKAAKSPSGNMARSYGELIGMGTQCFEMPGNTKRSILQSNLIPLEDQNLVTSQVLDLTEMFEVAGETFESSTTSWAFNIGLSFKGLSKRGKDYKLSGCFNFGMNGSVNTSEDYEYYLNVYKVVRGEIAYNMKEFEYMASSKKENEASDFLSYVSAGFIRDIMEVENERINTDDFFDTWGTDMISQAQLGGFKVYMYGRETNTYENSIGVDVSVDMKRTKPSGSSGDARQWYDIYMAKNSPYISVTDNISYMNDDYFSASKCMKFSLAVGGNPSLGDDPDSWINGFESIDENVKWQPISYRRRSDSAVPGTDEVWSLYPVEDMASNVIKAVVNSLDTLELSGQDSLMLENAYDNIVSIEQAKEAYIQRYLTKPKEATRLVLCDVFMKHDEVKQGSGKPEPFVAADPDDPSKKRIYYPMMANRFFDKARSDEHQRGRAIDTNVGCFISGVPHGSHYWYYTLAHEDDCKGLVDITFYDHIEEGFEYRGDAASDGSGLANFWKKVCVKYYDDKSDKPEEKITAFGIYDDHHEVNQIIASTGGSELAMEDTESEYNEWLKFWEGCRDHHEWPKYAFYHGGGRIPHGIYVKFTTKDLPIDNIKNIRHPDKY